MLGWARRLIAAFVTVVALVVTLGAANAAARGITVHGGPIGGIVRPLGDGNLAVRASDGGSPLLGISGSGPGSPSPYCSPGPPQAPACVPPLLYWGGPVMHAVTTHVIAWGSAAAFPTGYVSGYEQYLSDVKHDLGLGTNITSVAREYVDASGPALSSLTNDTAITDTDAYPTSGCRVSGVTVCLTEQQLLTEVGQQITSGALTVSLDQSYILLLPPNVDTCIDSSASSCEAQSFCGYHDLFTDGAAEATFTLLPYTESSYSNSGGGACIDPTVTYPGSSPALMALDSIGAHELVESATDPAVGSGYLDANGWEIGDECAWVYGTTNAATGGGVYNQLINGNQYLTQMMWSNQDNNCEQGDASIAKATITSSPNPTTSAPTSFSASLTGASATGATYKWSYEDPNGNLSQNVASGASPQITLSTLGTYTVWVQVSDAAGGTVIGVTDVTVGAVPTASFNYTTQTAVPATGSAVSFRSTSTAASGQSITSWAWDFGDGTTGSGSSVSHTYTSPGQYTVMLTVTQTDGLTASVSHMVTVVGEPPMASFVYTTSTSVPATGTAVSFTSTSSADSSETITSSSWDFGDGTRGSGSSVSHTYTAPGSYTVTLTVTETDGQTASTSQTVAVVAPPTAAFSWGSNPTAGTSLAFSSSGTSAGSGSITTYQWDFGDGGTASAADPSHAYATAGSYTVTLTVTQADGLTTSTQHTLTVAAAQSSGSTSGSTSSGGTSGATTPGGTTGSGATTGSGSSTGTTTANTHATATTWLTHVLAATRGSRKITTLLKQHGTRTVVSAPSFSGHVTITWYATIKRHRVVVARGSASVTAGVAAHVVIKLTGAGRALLARSRTVRITASGSYRLGNSSVTVTRKLTLRRH